MLTHFPLDMAVTVGIAGRQRTLTQKAVKDACMMRNEGSTAKHAQDLTGTVNLFDSSLKVLQDGNAEVGVIAAPTPQIARNLIEIDEIWKIEKTISLRPAAGEVLDNHELTALAGSSETCSTRCTRQW